MPFTLSTDRAAMQLDVIHGFLTTSYWSPGIPREIVARAIANSWCIGAFDENGVQIGVARVVSDYATFAYLADVFVADTVRGQGVASAMLRAIDAEPSLQGLRRWMLMTRDAHSLYARFGYEPAPVPSRLMLRDDPDVYLNAGSA
jgi:GNAT superfamily N-acetyltransferase